MDAHAVPPPRRFCANDLERARTWNVFDWNPLQVPEARGTIVL